MTSEIRKCAMGIDSVAEKKNNPTQIQAWKGPFQYLNSTPFGTYWQQCPCGKVVRPLKPLLPRF